MADSQYGGSGTIFVALKTIYLLFTTLSVVDNLVSVVAILGLLSKENHLLMSSMAHTLHDMPRFSNSKQFPSRWR